MNLFFPNLTKYDTTCCALTISSMGDHTPPEEIDTLLHKLRVESKMKWDRSNRGGGETLILVVSVPGENVLEKMLKERKFKVIQTFSRRTGYPKTGKLRLWALDLME